MKKLTMMVTLSSVLSATALPLAHARSESRAELMTRTSSEAYLQKVEADIEASLSDPSDPERLAEEVSEKKLQEMLTRNSESRAMLQGNEKGVEVDEDHVPRELLPARRGDTIVYEAYQDADYAKGEDQFGALFINGTQVDAFWISTGKGKSTPYGAFHPIGMDYFHEAARVNGKTEYQMQGAVHFKPRYAVHGTLSTRMPLFGHDASLGCSRTEERVVDGFYQLAHETPWSSITIVIKRKPGADVIHPRGVAPWRVGRYEPSQPLTDWAKPGKALDRALDTRSQGTSI